VGLAGAVLVAAAPFRPVQAVGPVAPGRRDDGAAQEPHKFRDGDRDQPCIGSELASCWRCTATAAAR